MNTWFYLFTAIAFEILATSLLKMSNGFERLLIGGLSLCCYGVSFYLFSQLLRSMPIGLAYAVWSGVGIVAISLIGWLFMGQKLDMAAVAGMLMIVCGVVVINLFSRVGSH